MKKEKKVAIAVIMTGWVVFSIIPLCIALYYMATAPNGSITGIYGLLMGVVLWACPILVLIGFGVIAQVIADKYNELKRLRRDKQFLMDVAWRHNIDLTKEENYGYYSGGNPTGVQIYDYDD